jgi:sec-independent protein translocase protein TatA
MFGKFEELVVLLIIVLVLFGGKKLPELAKSIGESVREVRKGFAGDDVTVVKANKSKPAEHKS